MAGRVAFLLSSRKIQWRRIRLAKRGTETEPLLTGCKIHARKAGSRGGEGGQKLNKMSIDFLPSLVFYQQFHQLSATWHASTSACLLRSRDQHHSLRHRYPGPVSFDRRVSTLRLSNMWSLRSSGFGPETLPRKSATHDHAYLSARKDATGTARSHERAFSTFCERREKGLRII